MNKKLLCSALLLSLFSFLFLCVVSKPSLQIIYQSENNGMIKVYYDNGEGKDEFGCYDEQHSAILNILASDGTGRASNPLPVQSVGHLRFDLDGIKAVDIYEIYLSVFGLKAQRLYGGLLREEADVKTGVILEGLGSRTRITSDNDPKQGASIFLFYFNPWKTGVMIALVSGVLSLTIGFTAAGAGKIILLKTQDGSWFFNTAYKKRMVCIAAVFFLAVRIFGLVRYRGYYAFDEFYHLMDKNQEGVMFYRRAPYINGLIAMVKNLFGSDYFSVKAVPFLLGCISFACFLYLLYQLSEKPLSILAGALALTLNPLVIYNHMYIRMYIFQEAVYMLMMFSLFQLLRTENQDKRIEKAVWIACFNILPFLYFTGTRDSSRYLLILLSVSVSALYVFRRYLKRIFKRITGTKRRAVVLLVITGFLFVFAFRSNITTFIGKKSGDLNWTANYLSDKPVLLLYLALHCLPVLLGMAGAGFYIFKKKVYRHVPIYLTALLPLLGFVTVFADFYVLRTFMPFLPGIILFGFYYWERKLSERNRSSYMLFIAAFTVVTSYHDFNLVRFYRQPYIKSETRMDDVGGAVDFAREKTEEGANLATIFYTDMKMDYFNIQPELNLNRYTGYTDGGKDKLTADEFMDSIETIESSGDDWVILTDEGGLQRLKETGVYTSWMELYEHREFESLHTVFWF